MIKAQKPKQLVRILEVIVGVTPSLKTQIARQEAILHDQVVLALA